MAIGVDPAVKAVQPPALHPVPDAVVPQAQLGELSVRDHTPLTPRELTNCGWGAFPFHFGR